MFCIIHNNSITLSIFFFFFFNDTATTEIYTLSLHDALPIFAARGNYLLSVHNESRARAKQRHSDARVCGRDRSEEHTSELQSQSNLVCRLLLEKKKNKKHTDDTDYYAVSHYESGIKMTVSPY